MTAAQADRMGVPGVSAASPAAARLRAYVNWRSLEELAAPSDGWMAAIRHAGYDGVQLIETVTAAQVAAARAQGLGVCGSGRVNRPEEAAPLARQARDLGLECVTVHLGWGMEDDAAAHALIESCLEASAATGVPLFLETHRATILQDIWRTVQIVRRYPELRLIGDLSHWYTGQEMIYGGFEAKLAFIAPALDRVDFLHGRISDPGCMQVDVTGLERADEPVFIGHYRAMWTRVFQGWLARSAADATFCFTTELLSPAHFYERPADSRADRWEQSHALVRIARACFAEAMATQPTAARDVGE